MILENLDIIILAIYITTLIILGIYFSRNQENEDFLIANRNLNSIETMMTLNATKVGATLMTFTALVYIFGLSAIWYFIGVITGIIIFIPFAIKIKKNITSNHYTLAHYLKYSYGKTSGALASILSISLMMGLLIVNLIAGASILTFFIELPFWACTIIVMAITLSYVILSGFKSVVKTDIVQYAATTIILIIITILLFKKSLISPTELEILNINHSIIISFFLVGIMYAFGSPDIWQRVYAAKGKRELKNGLLLSTVTYAIMVIALSTLALTIKSQFPNLSPNIALIHGFSKLLPSGLLGLSLVLLFTAIMSSIDTYLFTAGAHLSQDFSIRDKEKTVKSLKISIIILAIASTLIAILIKDLLISSYIFASLVIITGTTVLSTWAFSSVKEKTLVSGLIFGIISTIIFSTYGIITSTLGPLILVQVLISTIIGLIFGEIITRCTPNNTQNHG